MSDAQSRIKKPTMEEVMNSITSPELLATAMVESSKGKDLNHETTGRGFTAGGPFGTMPYTASDVYEKSPDLQNELPGLGEVVGEDKWEKYHNQITQILNENPDIAKRVAEEDIKQRKAKNPSPQELFGGYFYGQTGIKNKMQQDPQFLKKDREVMKRMEALKQAQQVLGVNKTPQKPNFEELIRMLGGRR